MHTEGGFSYSIPTEKRIQQRDLIWFAFYRDSNGPGVLFRMSEERFESLHRRYTEAGKDLRKQVRIMKGLVKSGLPSTRRSWKAEALFRAGAMRPADTEPQQHDATPLPEIGLHVDARGAGILIRI